MGLLHYLWSRTAASNATADSNVNWAEGMAPSAVNDSARAMMASAAGFRDDIAGAIITGGTSTAYTVTSYQIFSSLALMSGHMVAFTPHTTNGATVTLNVDGLGAKALRTSTGVELLAGTLIAGTPYTATYNNSDSAWYLHGFYGNPYNIPLGGAMMYFGTTAPNSGFVLPYGQAISRSTYSTLFSLFSTTFGAGDGSTTFNVPDLRGRIVAGKDDMGGSAASRITTAGGAVDGATLGAVGGGQSVTLVTANLPAYTPAGSIANGAITITGNGTAAVSGSFSDITPGAVQGSTGGSLSASQAASTFTGTAQGGTSSAVKTLPPSIVSNYILRVI